MSQQDSNKTPGREFAVKFLFQLFIKENEDLKLSFQKGEIEASTLESELMHFKVSYTAPDEEHENNQIDDGNFFFASKLLKGISNHMGLLEETISKECKRENLDVLEKVDRCILLVGTEEILHFDTPPAIVINELVNLAKTYGGANSSRFINGVLDGIKSKK